MNDLTPEQDSEEMKQFIKETIRKSNAFWTGESKTCPTCDEPVTAAKLYAKIEPEVFSLYVLPCNHRLGLWAGAPEWITDVEIVPSIWDNEVFDPDEPEGGWD